MKIDIEDDGLFTPAVGTWSEDKYLLLWTYADLFATSMKEKWEWRVYIDLFAGAGRSRIRGTKRHVLSSPLLALKVANPFDRYIFCEKNIPRVGALKQRVSMLNTSADVRILEGDVNHSISRIIEEMPPIHKGSRVLTFCFADPYRFRDLDFSTVEVLANLFVDFLILLPTGMDGLRNKKTYLRLGNLVVEKFLGSPDWRNRWNSTEKTGKRFDTFLEELYWEKMQSLNYQYGGLGESKLVRSTEKNLPLYRLAFFSRHQQGSKFWREAKKYSNAQLDLF